jgi:hypothetical protein
MDAEADGRKKIGYALFIAGIILIAYVVGSIIFVFVGIGDVPIEILKSKELELDQESQDILEEANMTSLMEMSMEDMYPMYNLMIWLTLAFMLLFAGYFLCKLGLTAMTPPTTPKPIFRRAFGGKKYDKEHKEGIEREKYDSLHDEEFENRPYDPI